MVGCARSELHCRRVLEHGPPEKFKNLDLFCMLLRPSGTSITVHNLQSLRIRETRKVFWSSRGQKALSLHPGNTARKIRKPYEIQQY